MTIINQATVAPFCGDNICTVSIGEDIINCPQDCVGLRGADFSDFIGKLGAIPRIIIGVTVVSLLVLAFREDVRRRFAKSLKGGKRLQRLGKRKFRKIIPEGFREGRRIV